MGLIPGADPREAGRDPEVSKNRGRYFGLYQGFVANRADPLKQGRVQVLCPSILQASGSKGWLDWCLPANGIIAVPPMNWPVWVEFEMGYTQNGVYRWGWVPAAGAVGSMANPQPPAAIGGTDPNWLNAANSTSGGVGMEIDMDLPGDSAVVTKPVYPYNKVFTSESGFTIEMDDSPGQQRLRVYHPKGSTILIDGNGSVQIASAGSIDFRAAGDIRFLLGSNNASFKIVYPNSTALCLGRSGLVVTGPQANILGRPVRYSADAI